MKGDYYAKWAQNSSITFEDIVSVALLQRYLDGKGIVNSIDHEIGSEIYIVNYTANDKEKSTYIIELKEDGTAEFSEGISIPTTLTLVIENIGEEQNKIGENIRASLSNLEGNISWSIIEGAGNISLSGTSGEEITVTPEAKGSAKIQASCEGYSAICNVTIKEEKPIQSISIVSSKETINVDEVLNITANVTPADATENEFVWTSSNLSVASVSNSTTNEATVLGLVPGNTTISVTNKAGTKQDEITITVVKAVTGVTISETSPVTMNASTSENTESTTLTATVIPSDADNKSIIWSIVSGEGVVSLPEDEEDRTVESGNTITVTAGESAGSAVLRATTVDGNRTADITVNVQAPLKIGDEVTYEPAGIYSWNKVYATSNQTGSITLSSVSGGSYRITTWKILSIDESTEKVELVPSAATSGTVQLQGPQGYNNGVKLLNDACSALYGGTIIKGETEYTITARSINIEDFEGKNGTSEGRTLTDAAISERNRYYNSDNIHIGNTYTNSYTSSGTTYRNNYGYYTTNKSYPVIYERELNNDIWSTVAVESEKENRLRVSSQTQLIARTEGTTASPTQGAKMASTGIRPKQTFYSFENYSDFSKKFREYESGKTYASLLLPNADSTNYWVASRCIDLTSKGSQFRFHTIGGGNLGAEFMFYSSNYSASYNGRPLFPVVSLSSELISPKAGGGYKVK